MCINIMLRDEALYIYEEVHVYICIYIYIYCMLSNNGTLKHYYINRYISGLKSFNCIQSRRCIISLCDKNLCILCVKFLLQ